MSVVGREGGKIAGSRLEARYERVPGGVIKNAVEDLCVVCDIVHVGMEDLPINRSELIAVPEKTANLSDGVYSSGASKVGPEVLTDVFHGVDTDTVGTVRANKVLDPAVQTRDIVFILRVGICQRQICVTEPALLDVSLVVVVGDEALGMEVRFGVERVEIAERRRVGGIDEMVDDDINHEVHRAVMKG